MKDREVFTVIPGSPWTINSHPTSARNPQDAVSEILSTAKRFPVLINVRDGEQIIALEMDKYGRTHAVQEVTSVPSGETSLAEELLEDAPAASPAVAPVVIPEVPATAPAVAAPPAEEPAGQPEPLTNPEGSDDSAAVDADERRRRTITPLRLVGAVALIAVLGAGSAFALQGSDQEQSETPAAVATPELTTTESGWAVAEGQDVLAIVANRVITAQGTTLRVLDAETGEQVGETYDVQDTTQIRSIEGRTASAVDTGDGEVIVVRDGQPEVVAGVLNARGTEPVITQGREYVRVDGSKLSLGEGQEVLAATAVNVVLVESPNRAVVDGAGVDLEAPEPDARITQWISATEDRVMAVWSLEDTRWITSHDSGSGALVLQQSIGDAEVTVRSGIVRVGPDQYVAGDAVEPICTDGDQINATIVCPEPDGWVSADGSQTFPDKPEAVSQNYAVIAGTVTNVRTAP